MCSECLLEGVCVRVCLEGGRVTVGGGCVCCQYGSLVFSCSTPPPSIFSYQS